MSQRSSSKGHHIFLTSDKWPSIYPTPMREDFALALMEAFLEISRALNDPGKQAKLKSESWSSTKGHCSISRRTDSKLKP